MSAWQPADIMEVAGPGTAMSGRPKLMACRAVLRVPLRTAASMITVPWPRAAMIRFLSRKWDRAGLVPGGHSLITAPWVAIASSRVRCAAG